MCMCVYACVYVCMYVCVCVRVCACTVVGGIHMNVSASVSLYAYAYACAMKDPSADSFFRLCSYFFFQLNCDVLGGRASSSCLKSEK